MNMPPSGNAGSNQWQQPPVQQQPPSMNPINGFAITALVSSVVIAPLGIVFGHLALRQISRTGENGRGLAIGGLVIGYLSTAVAVIAILVFVVALNTATRSTDDYSVSSPNETYSAPTPDEVKIFVTNSGPATSLEEQSQMDAASLGEGGCVTMSGKMAYTENAYYSPCDGTWVVVDRFVAHYAAGEPSFTQADAEARCPGSYVGFHLSINCLELNHQ